MESAERPRAQHGSAVSEADSPPVLTITERAFRRAEVLLAREGLPEGALRVGLKGGGCTGYVYAFKLEPGGPRPDDVVMTSGSSRVYVDPKSAQLLAGSVLDFTEGLDGKGFTFENPNAKRTCGCGHSFST
jgi:iron-sulfur cluster assembly protein